MRKRADAIIVEAVAEIHEKCAYSRHIFSFLVVTGVMHLAEDAHSIQSICLHYWLDQFLMLALYIDFVNIEFVYWGEVLRVVLFFL